MSKPSFNAQQATNGRGGTCPVCLNQLDSEHRIFTNGTLIQYDCGCCGMFKITQEGLEDLRQRFMDDPEARAKLSHAFRQSSDAGMQDIFTNETIEKILKKSLPRPKEQVDLLVRWLGRNIPGPGQQISISNLTHSAVIGAKSEDGYRWVIDHLFSKGLVSSNLPRSWTGHPDLVTLTFDGWDYFEQLAKGSGIYRKAFMAMKFGDDNLDKMLTCSFRPAAKMAGFELFKLDDVPKAGLIDDRLRVEVQSSDFLIADLTHDNLGAYWEAGYAGGLGKPVIYTCEKSKFEATKTHFDTNHHLTIVWDLGNPDQAANDLKATIRATLPHIAKQSDDL